MSTQLDVLAQLSADAYRAENDVIDRLNSRGEKYVAAVGVVLAYTVAQPNALAFLNAGDVRALYTFLIMAGVICLVAALLLAIDSLRVHEYPTYPATEALMAIEFAGDENLAVRSIAKLYLDLRDNILAVNERRAGRLRVAGILTVVGFLVDVTGLIGLQIQ